jgi:SAM-dependent methyltransferase
MGISRGAVGLLAMTLGGDLQRGRVVTFGVQKVEATRSDIRHALKAHGFPVPAEAAGCADGDIVSHDTLFALLGYGRIDSIDYYPDEGPSLVLDLNLPLPSHVGPDFDLVYDGGTMEHCFNTVQLLRNAAHLTAPGGMVIHHVPMNNWVDHGFYQFSPTLFFDFYQASGFVDLEMKIHFMDGDKESYVAYDPARDPPLPYALGGKKRVLAFFSARRRSESAVPTPTSLIQGRYRATFGGQDSGKRSVRKGLIQRLRASARKRFFTWNATRL